MSETLRPPEVPGSQGEPRDIDASAGDFTSALRAAVATRGVSLEHLRQVLSERGSRVSVATLSYWRSGRSLPDRGGSMLALAELERALGLPAGFLTSKVNPRGPGSAVASALPTHYEPPLVGVDVDVNDIEAAVRLGSNRLGLDIDDGLERVSYHDRVEIRADRTDGAHDVRTVFVAQRAGVDRFPVWYRHDDRQAFPFVLARSNCTLGRVVELRDQTAVVAEMVLDHALDVGESVIVEHRLESIGQTRPTVNFLRRLGKQIRELVIEVRFPRSATPREAVVRRTAGDGTSVVVPATVVGNSLHLLEIDPRPGIYGLEWEW